jgi:hypothetical protein
MFSFARLISVFILFVFLPLDQLLAQSKTIVEMASLRLHPGNPGNGLVWQRTSPTLEKPEGPVLYQLLLNASGTPGTVPMFDTNPRHLANSPITVGVSNVAIGGLSIDRSSGILSFAVNQTFPGTGTVTSIATGTGLTGGPITAAGTISIVDNGVTTAQIGSGAATTGLLLTADGAGNTAWQPLPTAVTTANVYLPAGYCTGSATVPAWGGIPGFGATFACTNSGQLGTAVAPMSGSLVGAPETTWVVPTDWDGGGVIARIKVLMPSGTGFIIIAVLSACSTDGVAQPTVLSGNPFTATLNDNFVHTVFAGLRTSGCHPGDLMYIGLGRTDSGLAPQIYFLGMEIEYGKK